MSAQERATEAAERALMAHHFRASFPRKSEFARVVIDAIWPIVTEENDAERGFLAASVAVWREIDRLSDQPGGYPGLPPDTDLRMREREAWERYRDVLDAKGVEQHG